jgi:hypothetical protein
LNISFSNRYMFRSYDHLQAEIYTWLFEDWICLGPQVKGKKGKKTLFYFHLEDGHKTETCSGY